ncbi:MAG: acetyl-CoA carboxylase, biotin carboxyl carrier protein, partial [Balneolaceae bacterium]|nr:acetyl-CoA carboxylase, biotin carboxyl carrier protein [Balneolaceae bacterium]
MDLKLIKNLLDLIAESEVNEVSIEEGDFKIKVRKKGEIEQISYPQMPVQFQPAAPPAQPQQPQGQAQQGQGAHHARV